MQASGRKVSVGKKIKLDIMVVGYNGQSGAPGNWRLHDHVTRGSQWKN